MRTILVDDLREIDGIDLVIRSDKEFFENIEEIKEEDILYMDNDLACEKDGYQLLEYLIEEKKIRPNKVGIVSMNPVGRNNMEKILLNNGYMKVNYRYFKRID